MRLPIFIAALLTACLVAGLGAVRGWRNVVAFVTYRMIHGWE